MEEEGPRARNTLQLQLKNLTGLWGRRKFVLEIVFGLFKLKAEDVLCLKDSVAKGSFDLTLNKEEDCWKAMKIFEDNKEKLPASVFNIEPRFLMDWRTVFVSMACPFLPVEDISTRLKRSLELKSELPVKMMDSEGIWNGVWRYMAKLHVREGRMMHILPDLMIGSVRGTVFYRGQPKVCYKCHREGHLAADCGEVVCKNCSQVGHVSRNCPSGTMCNLCGSKEHVYRDCPESARSYAQAAGHGVNKKEAAKPKKTEKGKKTEEKDNEKNKGESVGGGASKEGGRMAGNFGSEKTKERGGEPNREAEKKRESNTQSSQQKSSEGFGSSMEDSMEGVEVVQRKRKVDGEGATANLSWAKSVEEEEEKRKKKGESETTNSGAEEIMSLEGMSMEKKEDVIMNRFCATELAELLAWKERLRKGRFPEKEWRRYEGERQRILLCARWKAEEVHMKDKKK